MRLRMELFVDDLDASIAFYTHILGFRMMRREGGYASLRNGTVILGLGLVGGPPAGGPGEGLTQTRLAAGKGGGVEIVLELDDTDQLTEFYHRCRDRWTITEPLRQRPWGLADFRLTDPDGYYLRITHGDYTAEPDPAT
ncbi:catechol 2,3-dioxygenase-like lactoylglutathione lyase family enzyme [Hamadaea flava]|uniref:VOC family protein n=1 Tax=Hamadaea flava TaxID=1742688 RepID=A0ABV8LXV5_9ACTN|nr:VOC family protein [Hamadaea flava]MCP2329275.1 catechol 2,3-dioxygenase-like lactoylglutathione lyase family enzyme [Hamadaea flava]